MITYINGSPKLNNSASNKFLNDIKSAEDKIQYVYMNNYEDIIANVINSDTIVLSFPLYADSPTSGVLDFFEYIKNNTIDLSDKNLYYIVNCGFYEPQQNNTAIDIVRCFCENNKINFKGGLSIGAGPIIGIRDSKLIYRILTKSYDNKINEFKEKIQNNKNVDMNITLSLNKRLYVYAANISWKNTIKHANKK